jgi:hypothetical protein
MQVASTCVLWSTRTILQPLLLQDPRFKQVFPTETRGRGGDELCLRRVVDEGKSTGHRHIYSPPDGVRCRAVAVLDVFTSEGTSNEGPTPIP